MVSFHILHFKQDFIANDDDSTQVTNTFHPPFSARYVRIYPVSWVERIALRFELLGVKLTNGNVTTVISPSVIIYS